MDLFNIFLSSETGILVFAVISITQTFVKPIIEKFRFRNDLLFKKIFLPGIILVFSCLGSLIYSPTLLITIGSKLMWGAGCGLISNYVYANTGVSIILKKILPIKEKDD
jgi:hypothetical protein